MTLTRIDRRPVPKEEAGVRAFSCIRNERVRLPQLLAHHRKLGVTRFFFVDHGSTDASGDFLLAQEDVHVWQATGSYRAHSSGFDWISDLLNEFAVDRWALLIDADELLIYPACERVDLGVLTSYLDRLGVRVLRTLVLDMYSDRPVAETLYGPGDDILQVCPYFDRDGYYVRTVQMSGSGGSAQRADQGKTFGGARQRVFWADKADGEVPPYLTNYPLQRWIGGGRIPGARHWTNLPGADTEAVTGALLHFKFIDSLIPRALEEVQRKEHAGGAVEYAHYAAALRRTPRLSLFGRQSLRYRSSEQLVDLGLIAASPGYRRACRRALAQAGPAPFVSDR